VCRDRDCRVSCGNPSIVVWQTDTNSYTVESGETELIH